MDYAKVTSYISSLRVERENLSNQAEIMKQSLQELERRIQLKTEYEEILKKMHSSIFGAAADGKDSVILFMTLFSTEYGRRPLWKSLQEAQMTMDRLLRETGVKNLHVENIAQHRIRRPKEVIPDDIYDSVISFRVTQEDGLDFN